MPGHTRVIILLRVGITLRLRDQDLGQTNPDRIAKIARFYAAA